MKNLLFFLGVVFFLQSCSITKTTKLRGNKPLIFKSNTNQNKIEEYNTPTQTFYPNKRDSIIEIINNENIKILQQAQMM